MLDTLVDLLKYVTGKLPDNPTPTEPVKTIPTLEVGFLRAQLQELVNKPSFAPTIENGVATVTHCNEFVQSVLHLFNYHALDDMMANAMVKYMQDNPQSWKKLPETAWAFQGNQGVGVDHPRITELASKGHLIVFGLIEGVHGHVCVAYPGEPMSYSPSFHRPVSAVSNVGRSNFVNKPMSFSFVPTNPPSAYLFLGNA